MAPVTLGDNVCISQGAYLCTGNHDWTDPAFSLITQPIRINDGAWIAARASLGPGVVIGRCSVVGFGAVVTKSIPPNEIHGGNPAKFLQKREMPVSNGGFADDADPESLDTVQIGKQAGERNRS